MTIIDITKDYLELFTAKKDIETMLIEREEITEPFEIDEFIKYLNFGTHIYWVSSVFIYPFKIINTPNDKYMFVVTENATKNITPLIDALKDIDFNFVKLTHKDKVAIATEDLIEKPHFIINNELYYKE